MMTMTRMSPIPIRATKQAVSQFAEQVAQRLGYGPGSSMHEVVSKLKGRISYHDEVSPDTRIPESIVVSPDGAFQIFLPTVTSSERDRFTIAHELGHFFLHFPTIRDQHPGATMVATRWVNQHDDTQKRAEWEANWFAAAFVMPSEAFRAVAADSLHRAALTFGVSLSAAQVRARSLGIN